MTFIGTDAKSTYTNSTKHRKKIKGKKGEDEREVTILQMIFSIKDREQFFQFFSGEFLKNLFA